jgi:hypothetical protein
LVQGGVRAAWGKSQADGNATRRTAGGTLLSLKNYFVATQESAFLAAQFDHVSRATTVMLSQTQSLDRANAGDGYRFAFDALAAIRKQHDFARDLQYRECLQAYATLLAQTELGRIAHAREARGNGTELATQVDVDKIQDGVGLGADGLDETPGVMRLELERKNGSLRIARAVIAGFKNDAVLDGFGQQRLGTLKVPIVASFNENGVEGFVIGRNEQRSYFVDSNSDALGDLAGGRTDDLDAARFIFEHVLAPYSVRPERG